MQMDLFYTGKQLHCQDKPQGGTLLPLLWSLVVDDLLWELDNCGYYTVGYAADIAILINGKFIQIVSGVSQTSLCIFQRWCYRTNLSKMVVIPFTRKRNLKGLKEPTLFEKTSR
jgi:hypothetical protein